MTLMRRTLVMQIFEKLDRRTEKARCAETFRPWLHIVVKTDWHDALSQGGISQ
jgi:hypothetical protein